MKRKTKITVPVRKYSREIIPAQSALKLVVHSLRKMQHQALRDAIVFERAEGAGEALSLRLQADDFDQVATFLEARLLKPAPTTEQLIERMTV